MNKYFIDESGYTGYDLLNNQQPFQGASSIRIDEGSAKNLVDEYLPNIKANELKHKNLSRRKGNWNALLQIQRALLKDYKGLTYVCDKKYLLTLMFLNSCLEPYYYDHRVNFYEAGHSYSLASLIYYTAPNFWGRENYEELLSLFQHAVKTKSNVAVQALIEKARSLKGNELSEHLLPLSSGYHGCINEITNSESTTDAAFVVLLSLISCIEKYPTSEYEVVHDTSNNLRRYNELINWFISVDDVRTFKQTRITELSFPLKLSGVSQQDSRHSRALQLADILIGGAIEYAKAQSGLINKTDYNQAVVELYEDANIIHMLPSLDFGGCKEFRSGSQADELIEFISNNFSSQE